MSRIGAKFIELRNHHRVGLLAFLTVGFPDLESTLSLVPALVAGGADMIELGVPFSDPLADGATIQQAGFLALKQGVTLAKCLEVSGKLRESSLEVPIILMGYYNTFLNYGLERFCRDGSRVGVDGVIVVDLPPEEAGPLHKACLGRDMDLVFLLAPTSTEERIAKVCDLATGFVYCVSLTGVTGARQELPPGIPDLLGRVRQKTSLPLALGFGISTRAHVEAIAPYADAAVVGSALIDVIQSSPQGERAPRARAFLREMTGG